MSNWKVLIIDDEAQESDAEHSRYVQYNQLEKQRYDNKGFELTFAQDADNARQLLQPGSTSGSFDIVLLDVRLNNWQDDPQGTLFKDLFGKASERHVVALVSKAWDASSMVIVRSFLLDNPQVEQPLMFTFKDFESGGFAAICTQIVVYIRRKKSLFYLDLKPGDDIRILHLSDLHFGSTGADKSLAGISRINYLCERITDIWQDGPHFIAVTGDIGNTGHPDDYKIALDWFVNFTQELKISLPSPRILLVPGNHDVSIPMAGCQHFNLDSVDGESRPSLKFSKTDSVDKNSAKLSGYCGQPFSDFATKISAQKIWGTSPIGAWTEFGFQEYGVVFSGLNTSKKIDKESWPLRAIDDNDINHVLQEFKNYFSDNTGLLHVSLSHHSPVNYPRVHEEIEGNGHYLDRFLKHASAPRLLLHGHNHKRMGSVPEGDYMIIGAPSPSAGHQDQDSARGVNLISLKRDGSKVIRIRARSLVYSETGLGRPDNLPNKYKFKL